MLTEARRACQVPDVEFVRADAEALCFPDATFDLVVAMGMLEYLEHFDRAIGEVRRILRPGGEALFTVPTSVSASALVDRLIAALPEQARRFMLKRKELPQPDLVHRVRPWRLDRALSAGCLVPKERSFCQFTVAVLENMAPRCSAAIGHVFEPLGRYHLAGVLGRQYVVRTVRT
jgi:SAM-dependent methyltransferase